MSAQGVLTLRIFSGPHLGAELVLPAGTHSIGSDPSCDIILHDSSLAARHIQLRIRETAASAPSNMPQNSEELEVCLFSLDGPALVNGEALPDGQSLAPYTPCFLGLTCFAWGGLGQQADWRTVSTALHEASQAPANAVQSNPQTEDSLPSPVSSDSENQDTAPPLPTLDGIAANNVANLPIICAPEKPSTVNKTLRMLVFFLVILALCGLTISYEGNAPNRAQHIEIIKEKLKKAGFKNLKIEAREPGLTISGPLQNDTERGELVKVAQSMQHPVYLDVAVRTDRVNAISTAFNSRKLFPRVWEQSSDKGSRLHIAGYMKDGLVEEWAFTALAEDVALAEKPEIIRDIRHADAVEAILEPALKKAQLDFVQVDYLPGTIELMGAFDGDQRKKLDAVLDHTRRELGIPLNITVRSLVPEAPRQQSSASAFGVPAKGKKSGPDDLQVNGVTMTPMRFISLATGERIFEGGLLPGGYILESIGIHELKLRKDGRLTVYQLRGSNE